MKPTKLFRFRTMRKIMFALTMLSLAIQTTGCHRAYYRNQADEEAYDLIAQKSYGVQRDLQNYSIQMDPRSRMFDPFDPDHEPMPPDDPDSHEYMHKVDKKKGWPHWHDNGETDHVQNPDWMAYLPVNEEGILVLDSEKAMQLALLHSRDYQSQLEQLYLSALDVSFERFRFDTQFFSGYQTDYFHDGRLRNGTGDSRSLFTLATFPGARGIRMQKMSTTGADLVVGLANSLVWQFSGPNDYFGATLLDFTLVQPLLRQGGRARIMERLTLSERTLLANVRQMERWRRGFYLEIMTGRNAGQGPSRRGGVFGGSGFEGFTGTGGGFGRVGGTSGFGGGGTGGAQVGGFIGLLQSQQEIRNQEQNLVRLRKNYQDQDEMLQEMLLTEPSADSILSQRLQVAQSRQALLDAESRLLNSKNGYQATLDGYKITLGLPPHICVKIEDPMLDHVSVVDPALLPLQTRVEELREEVGHVIEQVLSEATASALPWSDNLATQLQTLRLRIDEVDALSVDLTEGDDSQLRRVQADGVQLGEKLAGLLESRGDDAGSSGDEPAQSEPNDLQVLRQILESMEQGDQWMETLQNWIALADQTSDAERLRAQLEEGKRYSIDWLKSDENPATREMHAQYSADIEALKGLTDVEHEAAIENLLQRIDQDLQPAVQSLQKLDAENGWLAMMEQWRAIPNDVTDEIGTDDPAVQIPQLKRLFVQFVDALVSAARYFRSLPEQMKVYRERVDQLLADGASLAPEERIVRFRPDISPGIPGVLKEVSDRILELSLVQARDRAETVNLTEIDLHPAAALDIARVYRRDWMNARASLVDTWRLIEFNANLLESSLDVVFAGDISSIGENPSRLHSGTGRLRARLEFDAPITRLSERNTYRQSLIEYQQARRNYYAFEDGISSSLRATIRSLGQNRENLKIRFEALRFANEQIQLNKFIEDSRLVPKPGAVQGNTSRATAARDAVSAFSDLLNSQNDFLSVWVTYEVLRQSLDFDLGTMEIDPRGMWIDPGALTPETGYPGMAKNDNSPCWPGKMVLPDGTACAPNATVEQSLEELPLPSTRSVLGGANTGEVDDDSANSERDNLLPTPRRLNAREDLVPFGDRPTNSRPSGIGPTEITPPAAESIAPAPDANPPADTSPENVTPENITPEDTGPSDDEPAIELRNVPFPAGDADIELNAPAPRLLPGGMGAAFLPPKGILKPPATNRSELKIRRTEFLEKTTSPAVPEPVPVPHRRILRK